MISKDKWKWYGNAGHFICSERCQFHLTTKVGKYLISTVGQYRQNDDKLGFQNIGCDRKFETMVFECGKKCSALDCTCGLPSINSSELDFLPYNKAGDAAKGHMKLCFKWAKKQ